MVVASRYLWTNQLLVGFSMSFFKNDDHYPESAWEVINLMDTYANTAKLILENEKKN